MTTGSVLKVEDLDVTMKVVMYDNLRHVTLEPERGEHVPLFRFECSKCIISVERILTPMQAREVVFCPSCHDRLTRAPEGATSSVVETLDNGAMPRRVTRLADIEQIMHDRSKRNS